MQRLAWHTIVAVAAALFGVLVPACTDTHLQPPRTETPTVDNELRLEGELCPSPAYDTLFPVKVLFVVDTSLSMSVTDQDSLRAKAIQQVMNRYAGYAGVEFGVIAFDSRVESRTDGFTNQPDIPSIAERLRSADRLTDYQGALGAAYTFLTKDIVKSSAAERARSKYVVIFFSDGVPDPQCNAGTVPCGSTTCPPHEHCRLDVCKPDYLICTVVRKDPTGKELDWASAFDPPVDPSLYPDLEKDGDYNQPGQILRAVDDIVALQDFFRVGEIRVHTAFLFDAAAAANPLATPFGLDRAGGVDIMSKMAEHGKGTFTEFDAANKINFLNVDYASFKEENDLVALIATNVNAIETGRSLVADTDGDGLPDDEEVKGKTCVGPANGCDDPADSDGDGYSDFIEEHNRVSGFDPKDPSKPQLACSDRSDADGDGLRDCEEASLKMDPRNPDSDGDRIPDRMEVLLGLDPLDPNDAFADKNRDGMRNADEIRSHLDPAAVRPANEAKPAYLYEVAPVKKPDGRKCYRFDVRRIQLLTTGRGTDAMLGKNRILVYLDEAPVTSSVSYGQLRVACADVRYVDGAFKLPLSGSVHFEDVDFVDVARFDPTRNCRDLTGAPNAPSAANADAGANN